MGSLILRCVLRVATLAAAALAVAPAVNAALVPATRVYSSGDLSQQIVGAGSSTLHVPESGPLSRVRVRVRLRATELASLSVRLVAPNGHVSELVARGAASGTDLGAGSPDCRGSLTLYDVAALKGVDSAGRWRLEVEDTGAAAAKLLCWSLTLTRRADVVTRAGIRAELTWDRRFANVRLTVFRGDSIVFADRLRPVCRACGVLPSSLTVRDLGGSRTPEIVVWANTGGAHCCAVAYVFRLVPRGARLTAKSFGNPGVALRVVGGVSVFVSGDDRFAYAFTSFAASSWPVQVWRWRVAGFVDVTRSYPSLVRADAARQWASLQTAIRRRDDPRGLAAAWAADEALLGRAGDARRTLDALAREGKLRGVEGGPANAAFVRRLWRFLHQLHYV